MPNAIEVTNLRKSYGAVHAVQNISFYAEQGKLFAFLGPNGAGKSTTISILCTLLQYDGGEVLIDGYALGRDDAKIRRAIGVVFQDNVLDPLLTVRENLFARGSLYGHSKARLAAACARAQAVAKVEDFAARRYGKLSGGQRRRADIARALVHAPKILFLDEPTTGLDPQTRRSIWDTVRALQRDTGMTVFLTTHYMEEAAEADYVTVIDNGLIAARGTPAALRETYSADTLKLRSGDLAALLSVLDRAAPGYTVSGNTVTVKLKHTVDSLPILEACQPHITHLEVQSGTMDDAFIAITGKELRE